MATRPCLIWFRQETHERASKVRGLARQVERAAGRKRGRYVSGDLSELHALLAAVVAGVEAQGIKAQVPWKPLLALHESSLLSSFGPGLDGSGEKDDTGPVRRRHLVDVHRGGRGAQAGSGSRALSLDQRSTQAYSDRTAKRPPLSNAGFSPAFESRGAGSPTWQQEVKSDPSDGCAFREGPDSHRSSDGAVQEFRGGPPHSSHHREACVFHLGFSIILQQVRVPGEAHGIKANVSCAHHRDICVRSAPQSQRADGRVF